MATAEAQDEMVTARQAADALGIARSNITDKIRLGHLVGIKEEGAKGEWSITRASLAKEMKRMGRMDVQAALKDHEWRIKDHEGRLRDLELAGYTRNPPERAAQDTGFLSAFLGAAGKVAP